MQARPSPRELPALALGLCLCGTGCASLRINVGATSDLRAHAGVEATLVTNVLIDAEPEDQAFGGPSIVTGVGLAHDGRGLEGQLGPGLDMLLAPDDKRVGIRGSLRAPLYFAQQRLTAVGFGAEASLPFVASGREFGSGNHDPRLLVGPYLGAQVVIRGSKTATEPVGFARGSLGVSVEMLSADD